MNKKALVLILLSFMIATNKLAYGQSSAVTSTWNYLRYGELDKAKKSIDEASQHPTTSVEPKTWLYKGQVYEKLMVSDKPEFKSLTDNPLDEAINAYLKCMELDAKGKFTEAINGVRGQYMGLIGIAQAVGNNAISTYNKQAYPEALKYFETYLRVSEAINKATKRNVVDTAFIFYAANSAYYAESKNTEKAIQYYTLLMTQYKYKDPLVYLNLSDMYKKDKKINEALSVLEVGLSNASDKKNIMVDRLNIFISQNQNDKAIEEGKKAIAMDPGNISLYLALGTIYQNMRKETEADALFKTAYERDPNNFNANNLLGVNYYNLGADKYNSSIEQKDMKKATVLENEAKDYWKKGLPFLEKAHQINDKDKETIQLLTEMYAKLDMLDKAKVMKDKLKK